MFFTGNPRIRFFGYVALNSEQNKKKKKNQLKKKNTIKSSAFKILR